MTPGDKVVCVDAGPCKVCGARFNLVLGQLYVVASVYPYARDDSGVVIHTIGYDEPAYHPDGGLFVGYVGSRFRKLDELKQEAQKRKEQHANRMQ